MLEPFALVLGGIVLGACLMALFRYWRGTL